jgi:hypothetical protein
MMKRIFALLVLSLFCLSSCRKQPAAVEKGAAPLQSRIETSSIVTNQSGDLRVLPTPGMNRVVDPPIITTPPVVQPQNHAEQLRMAPGNVTFVNGNLPGTELRLETAPSREITRLEAMEEMFIQRGRDASK